MGGLKPPPIVYMSEGEAVLVQGQLSRKEVKSKYQILYLKQACVQSEAVSCEVAQIIIYDYNFIAAKIGNQIQSEGELEFFDGPRNPGNFDQEFYYQKQGIYGAVKAGQVQTISSDQAKLAETLSQLKQKWSQLLQLAAGDEAGGILESILLGEKSGMDAEVKELYQKCGIGHILAISGLHISFIGMGIYYIFRKLGLPIWLSGGAGIGILGLYLIMIGMPVSAVRAYIMYCLRIGAIISGRRYDAVTALAFAAAVIIWRQPLYLKDAGFLLSFGAILGIICVLPVLESMICRPHKLLAGLNVSLAVNLVLLPFLLYYYFEFPTYSILLNLAVIPLMSVIIAGGLVGSLVWLISPAAGEGILWGCKKIFQLFEWLCRFSMKLPYSRIVTGQPAQWRIVVYFILLAVAVYCLHNSIKRKQEYHKQSRNKIIKLRWEKYAGAAVAVFLMVILTLGDRSKDKLQIVMLDVGQGDGIFMQGPEGGTYFIDGGSSDVSQVGKYCIEPFLKSQGIGKLDYVFISHGDTDHLNGIKEMMERGRLGVSISNLVLPPRSLWDEKLTQLAQTASDAGTKVYEMKTGQAVEEGEMRITCLQPDERYAGEIGNASSMVLTLTYGHFDMLLTGDVEGEGETLLKQVAGDMQYDVLKAAHHGSKNSTDAEFLEQIKPTYTIISAGVGNSYGHPHAETLERLANCGSEVFTTPENGAIKIVTDGTKIGIFCYNSQ